MCLLALVYTGGAVAIFSSTFLDFHRNSFQEEIKTSTTVVVLRFSSPEFNAISWLERNEEFNWSGKLYDVKQIKQTSAGFEIECVVDEYEESLIEFFDSWKKNFPSGKIKLKLQPSLLETFSFSSGVNDFFTTHITLFNQRYFFEAVDLISHPPEVER
jgi:hypothetical protein